MDVLSRIPEHVVFRLDSTECKCGGWSSHNRAPSLIRKEKGSIHSIVKVAADDHFIWRKAPESGGKRWN